VGIYCVDIWHRIVHSINPLSEPFPVEIPCYYLNRLFLSEMPCYYRVVTALGYLGLKGYVVVDVQSIPVV